MARDKVQECACVSLGISPSSYEATKFQSWSSNLTISSNPNYFPKTLPLNTIVELSVYPLHLPFFLPYIIV